MPTNINILGKLKDAFKKIIRKSLTEEGYAIHEKCKKKGKREKKKEKKGEFSNIYNHNHSNYRPKRIRRLIFQARVNSNIKYIHSDFSCLRLVKRSRPSSSFDYHLQHRFFLTGKLGKIVAGQTTDIAFHELPGSRFTEIPRFCEECLKGKWFLLLSRFEFVG